MPEFILIPTVLAEGSEQRVIPEEIKSSLKEIKHYFVENVRTARRAISALRLGITIEELEFWVVDKKTDEKTISRYVNQSKAEKIGIMSEAGCPGVADPGAKIAHYAHQNNFPVKPLVGPSSILLALMASGFSGQNFAFTGYIPVDKAEKAKRIKFLEGLLYRNGQTQIFMETPFRNEALFQDLVKQLGNETLLCVASNITSENEFIKTMRVKDWKDNTPNLRKIPTIFLIGAPD